MRRPVRCRREGLEDATLTKYMRCMLEFRFITTTARLRLLGSQRRNWGPFQVELCFLSRGSTSHRVVGQQTNFILVSDSSHANKEQLFPNIMLEPLLLRSYHSQGYQVDSLKSEQPVSKHG